jgi:type IV pilus assembly protein PilA
LKARGFSLIELLIVVAIILVIAAIAIPQFLNSRMAANEASAVSSVHQINTAEASYRVAYSDVGYADNLAELGPPTSGNPTSVHAGLIDWVLGCANQPCTKSGYLFAIANASGSPVDSYSITAVPSTIGQTGRRGFCGDRTNRLTVDSNGGTNCTSLLQ